MTTVEPDSLELPPEAASVSDAHGALRITGAPTLPEVDA